MSLRTSLTAVVVFLSLAGVVAVSALVPSVVVAQNNQATLVTKVADTQQVQAGQPLVIPFYLNTNGVSVDGVQVTGRFAGVPVSEVRLEMAGALKAQSLSQEVTNEGFTIMMSSADPSLPIVSNEDVLVFELTVVPAEGGEFRIEYDNENTLVPSSANSSNILMTPTPVAVAVGGQPGGTGGTSQPASLVNALLALVVAGILVAVGVVYMKKQNTKKVSTPSTPPPSEA